MGKALPLGLILAIAVGCSGRQVHYGPQATTKAEILQMHQDGAPDEDIVRLIDRAGMDRSPTADDIIEMKGAGISDVVITAAVEAPVRKAEEKKTYVYYETPDPGAVIDAAIVATHAAWHLYEFYHWFKHHR